MRPEGRKNQRSVGGTTMRESETSPEWIEALLMVVVPPAKFREDARRAVERAAGIRTLRQARGWLVVRPVGVRTYLTQLADAAGLAPERVAEWAELPDDPFEPAFGRLWGRFAATLGLDRRELLLHLRCSLLTASENSGPLFLAAAGRGHSPVPSTGDPLVEAERLVAAEVAGLDAGRRDGLHRAETDALAAWTGN